MSISVFADQAKFMAACGQTIDQRNEEQFQLYLPALTKLDYRWSVVVL